MSKLRLGLLGACLLLATCACSKSKPGLMPLASPGYRTDLAVKGFGPATVTLPLGATTPRPIVVVLHGERDKPEWQCNSFRGVLGGRVFILCPQGQAVGDGLYGWGSFDESVAELRAALTALKERYGAHVAKGSITLVGYAQAGAIALDLARQEPSFFARVALVNSDPNALSPSVAKIFGERGGKRMLFFCTSQACDDSGVERALWLKRANAEGKAVKVNVGPYLDQKFTDALKLELPWLLQGDSRFQPLKR